MIRQFIRSLGSALLLAGVLLVADAALTVAWQEPVSAVYARLQSSSLDGQLQELRADGPQQRDLAALGALDRREQRIAYLARSLRREVGEGEPVLDLSIPRIGLRDRAVVDGTAPADLRKGPGVIESTELPGLGGTLAIAGHRTTYGAPFHDVNRLRRGDRIEVGTPYGTFIYRVDEQRIVDPSEVWVLRRIGRERLVLTACHPLYSAAQRIIVFAELDGYRPPRRGRWASALDVPGAGGVADRPTAPRS